MSEDTLITQKRKMIDSIIKKCRSTRIMTPTDSLVDYYTNFSEMAKEASITFWPGDEYPVEDDLQDFMVNMTDIELHGVKTTLKLFSLYEIKIGVDYWAGYVMKNFPRPEITRMAAAFCHVENNSHAIFYDLINKALGLSSDEFYHSYLTDPVLVDRVNSIGKFINHEVPLVSVAAFSMLEGAVLYSSFSFLKSFSTNGKNLIRNTSSGISASITDELLHCLGGASLYNTLLSEANLTLDELEYVKSEVVKAASLIFDHEVKIIGKIFELGEPDHITIKDSISFVMQRVNQCLNNINIENLFSNIRNNKISDWFYNSANGMQSIDFFNTQSKEYTRGWSKELFEW